MATTDLRPQGAPPPQDEGEFGERRARAPQDRSRTWPNGRRMLPVVLVISALLGGLIGELVTSPTFIGAFAGAVGGLAIWLALRLAGSTRRTFRELGALERRLAGLPGVVRESTEQAGRATYRQLEVLLWLREALHLDAPLRPAGDWAAAPDMLMELVSTIDRHRPGLVVELGSGISTVVIARRLQQLGHGRLVTLEHDGDFARTTQEALEMHSLTDVVQLVVAPLGPVRQDDRDLVWYQVSPDVLEAAGDAIDMLFVDGPPGRSGPLARYPALPLLRHLLAPGALILVDDADRPGEAEAVRRWQAEVDALEVSHLPLEKGAYLIRMP